MMGYRVWMPSSLFLNWQLTLLASFKSPGLALTLDTLLDLLPTVLPSEAKASLPCLHPIQFTVSSCQIHLGPHSMCHTMLGEGGYQFTSRSNSPLRLLSSIGRSQPRRPK